MPNFPCIYFSVMETVIKEYESDRFGHFCNWEEAWNG